MPRYEFFLASSLEKVFPTRRPAALEEGAGLSVWPGARCAVQLVYAAQDGAPGMPVQRFSASADGAPAPALLRGVELAPSDYPCYENSDEFYLTREPGLFPDLLRPLAEPLVLPVPRQSLDTPVGGERPTVQLVGVRRAAGAYSFDFTLLARWTKLCRRYGVEYLEIPHLFTQWGAAATPKILAEEDGRIKRIFGWDVPADSAAYRAFLCAFLPALRAELLHLGYDDAHVFYHISDEPSARQLDAYRAARAQAADLLEGCRVADALSSLAFYRQGLVSTPICASDHIQSFLDENINGLWVCYCCAQGELVPNRFFAMESARSRIMGVLLYLYRIEGFLHWGYNFYNARFSLRPIDPFRVTHGDYGYPSGDPFLVYPGADGAPLSSIRAEVQSEALLDLRALQYLERLAGRAFTEALVYEGAPMRPITFADYPRGAEYLLALRERVAREIERRRPDAR